MRVSDYELSNLILRIEQDKNFTPKDSVVNLGALRDLVDAKATIARQAVECDEITAMKHTVVATIGGVDYEGFPTSEINYLQRLRILLEREQALIAIDSLTTCGITPETAVRLMKKMAREVLDAYMEKEGE